MPIKSSKMVMSSSRNVSWWRCSRHRTTAASSTMPVRWCPLTRHLCVPSRYWNRLTRGNSNTVVWTPGDRSRRQGERQIKTRKSRIWKISVKIPFFFCYFFFGSNRLFLKKFRNIFLLYSFRINSKSLIIIHIKKKCRM